MVGYSSFKRIVASKIVSNSSKFSNARVLGPIKRKAL